MNVQRVLCSKLRRLCSVMTAKDVALKESGILSTVLFNGFTRSVSNGKTNEYLTVCVEGNIGSGKTSLLEYFKPDPNIEVVEEPVELWRNIACKNGPVPGGQIHNALDLVYRDPKRWGLTFQTYVQLTMLDIHTRAMKKPIRMMERCIFSAKYCFVESLYRSGTLPEVEFCVLSHWFDWIMKTQNIKVDLIVYLRTKPETVLERIKCRDREEEECITLEYLQTLHDLHEDWLIHKKFPCPAPVMCIDGNAKLEDMISHYEEVCPKLLHGVSV